MSPGLLQAATSRIDHIYARVERTQTAHNLMVIANRACQAKYWVAEVAC